MTTEFIFKAEIWLYSGKAAWHFITLPKNAAKEIKLQFGKNRIGWGAIPVIAIIGKTTWQTSIFPDSKSNSYLLPVKTLVRKKEGVKNGDRVSAHIKIAIM